MRRLCACALRLRPDSSVYGGRPFCARKSLICARSWSISELPAGGAGWFVGFGEGFGEGLCDGLPLGVPEVPGDADAPTPLAVASGDWIAVMTFAEPRWDESRAVAPPCRRTTF